MSTQSPQGRLLALEHALGTRTCQTCSGHPSRIVYIDAETGAETGASMPADGCPACGRPVFREYQLIGMTLTDLP
jgi:hypothetical protein